MKPEKYEWLHWLVHGFLIACVSTNVTSKIPWDVMSVMWWLSLVGTCYQLVYPPRDIGGRSLSVSDLLVERGEATPSCQRFPWSLPYFQVPNKKTSRLHPSKRTKWLRFGFTSVNISPGILLANVSGGSLVNRRAPLEYWDFQLVETSQRRDPHPARCIKGYFSYLGVFGGLWGL